MNDFSVKLNKLPQKVRDYLVSMKASELNVFVCDKYQINNIGEYTGLISSLFFKETKISELENKVINVFGLSEEESRGLTLDILGIRLLVVDDYFAGEVSDYINKLGGKINNYDSYLKEQNEALVIEEKFFKEQLEEDKPFVMIVKKKEEEREFNPDIEREDSIKMFNTSIVGVLSSEPDDYTDSYNLILLNLLTDKEKGLIFKRNLEKALLSNVEKLTSNSLIYNNKKIKPSIANWIKYFIRIKGSDIFDNIILTDFMTKFSNTKNLSKEDNDVLTKLLILYRNVKFFPESMPGKDIEKWEIIPRGKKIDKAKEPMELPEQISTQEKEAIIKKVEDVKAYEQKLAELELLLAKYPDNSLERKMVEEEIVKFKKQKSNQ